MRKLIVTLMFLVVSACAINAQHDPAALKQLYAFATNINNFDRFYTQEKVYLHLDNNGYLPSETIWFKAYVFKASTLLPTDMSKVLYVELLSPLGQVIDRKTLPILNGRTYGNFRTNPTTFHSGYYEIRAYTRAMLNWDNAYIFSRVIPVYEPPTDTVSYTDLKLGETKYYYKENSLIRSTPKPLTAQTTISKGKRLVTFYPEGGHITQGLPSRVAYKIADSNGLPADDSITILDSKGNIVTSSKTLHDGMGVFSLPESWQGGYATITGAGQTQYALPPSRTQGADIHIGESADTALVININASNQYKGQTLGLSLMCRNNLCYFQPVTLQGGDTIYISHSKFKDGVNQLTLFTPQGEVLSERLVWNKPQRQPLKINVTQNKDIYDPFSPIALNLNLADSTGNPLQSDFSISVRDADTEMGPDYHTMQTDMLLASEIKGYVNDPDYYFIDNSAERSQALDLLLMVQGWRRYSWSQMAGTEPTEITQPAEDGLTLFGNITKTQEAKSVLKKQGRVNINFLLERDKGTNIFYVETDSSGNYALRIPNFYGDASSVITITNNKSKRIYSDLIINRNFSPAPRSYEPIELADTRDIDLWRKNDTDKAPRLFDWQDTIPNLFKDDQKLHMVSIKAKKPTLGYIPPIEQRRLIGENATKQFAAYYYDIPAELDKYLDKGEAVPDLFEWLSTVNPQYNYQFGTYHGKGIALIVDVDRRQEGRAPSTLEDMLMHRFRSLVVIEDIERGNELIRTLLGPQYDAHGGIIEYTPARYGAIIFAFTAQNEPPYYKRGTRWATIHGYSRCDDFYSPDYRTDIPPTPLDHRRTLYWNPSLTTDKDGKASIILYSNARQDQRLNIEVEGIAVSGQMFDNK